MNQIEDLESRQRPDIQGDDSSAGQARPTGRTWNAFWAALIGAFGQWSA